MGRRRLAAQHGLELRADVGVGIEAKNGVGLRQRAGQFVAVALGQTADSDNRLVVADLSVRRRQQGVDRVAFRRLDESAGVDQHGVGAVRVVDDRPAVSDQPTGQFLGVHLVARAAQRDQATLVAARMRARLTRRHTGRLR